VLPVFRTRLLQLLVALLDWMAAAAVLYVLLPADSVSYPVLLSAFVRASFLGVLAHQRETLEQQRADIEMALEEIAAHEEECRRLLAENANTQDACAHYLWRPRSLTP
jgi:septal ring factor EnvC (AmiA/AmiB activator)